MRAPKEKRIHLNGKLIKCTQLKTRFLSVMPFLMRKAKKENHSFGNITGVIDSKIARGTKKRRSKSRECVILDVLSKKRKQNLAPNGNFTTREFTMEKNFLKLLCKKRYILKAVMKHIEIFPKPLSKTERIS